MGQDRRFGLCQVYPDPKEHEATAEKKVDIIFMHGLDAESPKTWIALKNEDDPASEEVNWLCDKHMLPSSMPHARILTYDWNANYDTTASSDKFLGHADTLLDRVYALVRATDRYHPRGPKYRQVLDFTVGVAFLGTPFLGSWETGYSVADLRVAVAVESGGEYNRELMEYLRQGTTEFPSPLDDLVQRFSEMVHHEDFKFGKVCFYETRHTNFSAYRKKLPKSYADQLDANGHGIVVAKNSACLQGVEGVALDVRHNMLHKFNSPKNDGFRRLISRLKGFVEKAQYILDINGYSDFVPGADRRLREKEERRYRCLKALYFDGIDYEPGKIREPSETACQWPLKDPSYSDWHKGRGILWILGNPGSGKSTLIKHALHSCRENVPAGSPHVLSFFFHNQGKLLQHTTEGLLRALLYQLLEKFPEQTSTFVEEFDTRIAKSLDGPVWRTSDLMRHLESCLEKVVERFGLRVFVDALDECRVEEEEGDDETQEIRELIQNLQEVEQRFNSSPQKLSICFACRHYPNLARPGVDSHIIAEQSNREDIEQFVHQELGREITLDENKALRQSLEKEIVHSADGNFLWDTLVTARAVSMYRSGKPELLGEVQKIPRNITQIYESTINKLVKENPAMSLRFFQWVCFAKTPLRIQELRWAINIVPHPFYKTYKDIPGSFWGETDQEMEKLVRTLSGGLAKVGNSKRVVFIHFSDRHYLRQLLNPNDAQELRGGYPQRHRPVNYTEELEEWLVIDEVVSCSFGPSLPSYGRDFFFYFLGHWHDHALQSLENGSEYAVNKCLDNFFSRGQNSFLHFLNLVQSPLLIAAGLPNPIILSVILSKDTEHYFPLNFASLEENVTALMVASDKGYEDNVRVLLQQEGIQVDIKDSKGQTALMMAVGSKNKQIVELLINQDANINLQDLDGMTALVHSVRNDLQEITELLLQRGANTCVEDFKGLTAFDYAIDRGNTQLCRHVLERLTEQERPGFVGRKRMAAACKNGHTDIIRLFLQNGVKTGIPESQLESKFPFSESALGVTIAADQRAVLELLLDHESTYAGLPVWKTNLLCESVRKCAMECIMSLIIHYGWEIDEVDTNGDMPIHVAIKEGWASDQTLSSLCKIIKTLISLDWSPQGVIVNALNSQSQSPLMLAIGYCGTDCLVKQVLADDRVDINTQGPTGTPLWCSVVRKRHAVTECLLSYPRIDPNLGLSNGVTPLQAAIVQSDTKSASLLLDHKSIRVTEEDRSLLAALQAASDEEVLKILDGFINGTEHLYRYWTVELMDGRRAALDEIQTLVETWSPVGEQCFSEVQQRSVANQSEGDTIHPAINFLRLLLDKCDNGWCTIEKAKMDESHRASTPAVLLACLIFVFCIYAASMYPFQKN
ncbi:ankyrin repeat [Fusarium longipes]|uniref:Ankyrin repeat n=1 Tax=Fusarium longipes TaxID=694270 RepID=A0A395RSX5_9HYPO|nr:ankyrin repeat [Fusarium longipes]